MRDDGFGAVGDPNLLPRIKRGAEEEVDSWGAEAQINLEITATKRRIGQQNERMQQQDQSPVAPVEG